MFVILCKRRNGSVQLLSAGTSLGRENTRTGGNRMSLAEYVRESIYNNETQALSLPINAYNAKN
jgi:hypothetical protein